MKETKRIYVAPTGANTGLGTKDSPFTTVEAASNEARLAVASGNWASVEVIFLKGEYRIDPIKLTQADSGNADCPVCYKAQDGEEVILSGGITLKRSMFSPVCGEAADRAVSLFRILLRSESEKISALPIYRSSSVLPRRTR